MALPGMDIPAGWLKNKATRPACAGCTFAELNVPETDLLVWIRWFP